MVLHLPLFNISEPLHSAFISFKYHIGRFCFSSLLIFVFYYRRLYYFIFKGIKDMFKSSILLFSLHFFLFLTFLASLWIYHEFLLFCFPLTDSLAIILVVILENKTFIFDLLKSNLNLNFYHFLENTL